jgi:hypothetical protein
MGADSDMRYPQVIIPGTAMTEAPELRRARFHLLRAEDALNVVIVSLAAAPVPDGARAALINHAGVIQQQLQQLLGQLTEGQLAEGQPCETA